MRPPTSSPNVLRDVNVRIILMLFFHLLTGKMELQLLALVARGMLLLVLLLDCCLLLDYCLLLTSTHVRQLLTLAVSAPGCFVNLRSSNRFRPYDNLAWVVRNTKQGMPL